MKTNSKILGMLIAASLALSACDKVAEKEMKIGESSQEEVISRMGQPTQVWPESDGGKTLEMSRQPEGTQTYHVKISPDGKYLGMRNVLVDSMFEQIKAGMTPEQVRRLIGPPALKQEFKLKNETAQSYRFSSSPGKTEMFDVYYSPENTVIRTGRSPDPRNNQTN
jgi:outer membrane protein assembly factor BamE (lipoprotein component of BamABCDE complex)